MGASHLQEAADRIPDRFGIQDQNPQGYKPDGGTSSHSRYLPTGTSLPGNQEKLALAILALKKPTVLVIISGEGVAIDQLIAPADAILYHAYPGGTGGMAIAESILGKHNRFGASQSSWSIDLPVSTCHRSCALYVHSILKS